MPALMPGCSLVGPWPIAVACLVLTAGAQAGSGLGSAPVEAGFTVDHFAVKVQEAFRVKLAVRATQEIRQGRVSFHPQACAAFAEPKERMAMFDLDEGQSRSFVANLVLQAAGPCSVVAEVLTLETATSRKASVFGLTVNPVPSAPLPGVRHGRTADGQKTIEAPAASR